MEKFKWQLFTFWLAMILIVAALVATSACNKNAVQAPLPTGAVNQVDFDTYRGLIDVQAAMLSIEDDISSGVVTMNATQLTVLGQVRKDYNIAEAAWQAYHAGATGDAAGLQAAVNQVVGDLVGLATAFPANQKVQQAAAAHPAVPAKK